MSDPAAIDGVLVQWGDRLFYPGNRIVKGTPLSKLPAALLRQRANAIRARIEATVVRRVPQVMVKVTGGGRGMKAIAAHFKYISKSGRLDIEDDRGEIMNGKGDLRGLVDDWRLGGTPIEEVGFRREAFNIMLSMPRTVDPLYVLNAAREFAHAELADHKYVMVLHDHQANPHVHLSVRAESRHGKRLNPRKADLARWRQTFAEKLRGWGVEAEASSRVVRGQGRPGEALWRVKAQQAGRTPRTSQQAGSVPLRSFAVESAWQAVQGALAGSDDPRDRQLGDRLQSARNGPVPDVAPHRGPEPSR
ncbi:MAG TPA: conjugal transfer protein TraS [Burkholderiaceae bacterium]|nr:conjugal transfer protein TraS [Burkholderiaceae bacterium]